MTNDRPVLGMMLMLGFCIVAPMGDSIAKVLGPTIPLLQLLFVRFVLQALFLAPVVAFSDRTLKTSPRITNLIALRTILHILGVGAMFLSLRFLPLADAVAIAFVMPFIMLLLGRFVLNETVGMHRMVACVVGFIGTLLVIQPSFAEVGAPALLPLFVAVDFALFMLVTRQLAKHVDPISLQTSSGAMATVVLSVVYVAFLPFDHFDLSMVMPDTIEIILLIAIGFLGTMAHLLMTWSLMAVTSARLEPVAHFVSQ